MRVVARRAASLWQRDAGQIFAAEHALCERRPDDRADVVRDADRDDLLFGAAIEQAVLRLARHEFDIGWRQRERGLDLLGRPFGKADRARSPPDSLPTSVVALLRSEERRVGKEGTSWCRSRWSRDH